MTVDWNRPLTRVLILKMGERLRTLHDTAVAAGDLGGDRREQAAWAGAGDEWQAIADRFASQAETLAVRRPWWRVALGL